MNIIIGGLLQESNTFSEASSAMRDFEQYYFRTGSQLLEPQKAENELAGFIKAAADHPEMTLLPTVFAQAVSSGKIPRRTFDELKRLLAERLAGLPACDGVLFTLHGAWVAEDNDDADGEIVELLRLHVGPDVPIVITLDSHANVTRKLVETVDGIVGYRTFPHTDYVPTGYRAAELLRRIVRGEAKPHIRLCKVPMIVPAERHETARGPMAELWEEALAGEREGRCAMTSLFLVQPWLDIAEMGCSVVVMDDDPAKAEEEAGRLAASMWSKRKQFDIRLYGVEEMVVMLEEQRGRGGPVVVSDSADSPGAGSPGDSNFVLRELLRLKTHHRWNCLLSIVDPGAARAAAEAGEGRTVRLQVGHSVSRAYGEPLAIEGVVAKVGSGKFRFGGGTVAGLEANMGRCAVVQIGTVSVLLMENATFTGDPAMYRSVGLEPADADLVLVKSAAQFRAEYELLTDRIYILDTPGASTANLTGLPFRHIPRPMYPFDSFD
ncbi:M81 family metallopeptidase [Paenibacillus ginsengarvi]|nr:M81 family metallopeptidase [Paenibacillus ginsengarvi]